MQKLDHYLQRIIARYPDMKINCAQVNNLGMNNVVIIVNNAAVFRYPRYAQGLENLKREAGFSGKLNARLPRY